MKRNKQYTVISRKGETNPKQKFICQVLLKTWFFRANLQWQRIQKALREEDDESLYTDIHFLFICFGNINKQMERLQNLYQSNADYKAFRKKYLKRIQEVDTFRDHLEHIDDKRIYGKNKKGDALKDATNLGSIEDDGDSFNFGGELISLKGIHALLGELGKDFYEWQKTTPPLS